MSNVIVSTGSEPPVAYQPQRAVLEKVGGVNRNVWLPEVKAKPQGPLSVVIVVPTKDPIYLTPDEARAAAAGLIAHAEKVEKLLGLGVTPA
jgi:hypothetical protein